MDEWLEELSHMDAVAMGSVIRELNKLTASEESSVTQLVREVTKDPTLTSKIIKVANSALYNPAKLPINTASRAIMHVGFETIRAICVSSMVIENLLKEHPREQLIKQMARSFHAGVQARNLFEKARVDTKEEVFIAALFLHLGELLIWAYPHPVTDKAYAKFRQGGSTRDLEAILGVTFDRLTRELAEEWRLGETLQEALVPSDEPSRMSQAVKLGEALVNAMEKGLDSPEMLEALKKAAEFTGKSEEEVKKRMLVSADEAADLSKMYGDPKITQLIKETRTIYEESAGEVELIAPNSQFQLEALQSIMQMMSQKVQPGQLFQTVLDGLHKGVGMERVALAIFNASRTQVSAKYVIGQRTVNWRDRFRFAYEKHNENLFAVVMSGKLPVWVGPKGTEKLQRMRSQAFDEVAGIGDFFLGPVVANNRQVGFVYADLRVSGRPLNDAYFTGFKHFVQQTSLCLGILAKQ